MTQSRYFRFYLVAAAVCATAPSCTRPTPLSSPAPAPDPIRAYLAGRTVIYTHLATALQSGQHIVPGTTLGKIDTMPTIQSARHQAELLASRDLYSQGRFLEAAAVAARASGDEPDNVFLLNERARALFRVDSLRSQSAGVYERLVALLDASAIRKPGDVVIDLWFGDAYWKRALLCLDVQDFHGALEQLVKVALSPGSDDPNLREQLFGYLAETYSGLGDAAAANHFVDLTLQLNPRNTYVLQFRTPK